MKRQLQNRVYTCYSECTRFIDASDKKWILITPEQDTRAKKFIKKHSNNMFTAHSYGTADYLIGGSIVKTRHSTAANARDGWCYDVSSETKKGLKNILNRMGLPLK